MVDASSLSDRETTAVETAADIEAATEFDSSMAEKLMHVARTRADTIGEATVVVLSNWAYQDWSDYDIANEPAVVVGTVENYSEAAYKLHSAFEVLVSEMDSKSVEEVKDEYYSNLVEKVDETDEDFHDERGEMFVPKSAVETILVVAEE